MKYFDMFSGIGGFSLAIHNAYGSSHVDRSAVGGVQTDSQGDDEKGAGLVATAGEDISATQRRVGECPPNGIDEGPLCVGFSEIDKYATSVYKFHYPNVTNYGDATKIDPQTLPDFDLLVGGFPCQAFSIAGKRRGFADIRGTLFFEVARIIKEKRPRLLLLENVKGLLSHANGNTFYTIIATLDELGYDVQWQVLNSKDFGVPQNRERVFIIGHLRGTPRPKVFPITGCEQADNEDVEGQVVGTISARYQKMGQNDTYIHQLNHPTHSNNRVYGETGISPTLNTMQGGMRQPKIARTIRVGGGGSPHGSRQNWDSYEINKAIRRLTPLECERLMGFPDNWTKYGEGHVPISDSQRYKMCGNAVVTNVVEYIISKLK